VSRLLDQASSAVHQALRSRGFLVDKSGRGPVAYAGVVTSGSLDVPIRVEILDPLMTSAPKVTVTDAAILGRIKAHLNSDGTLCYADQGLEEHDLYDAGRAALRVLQSVTETLAVVLHGSPRADLEREFLAYWKPTLAAYADLPSGFSGVAKMCAPDKGGVRSLITTPERLPVWMGKQTRGRDFDDVHVVQLDRPLATNVGKGPGGSLASVRAWLSHFTTPEMVGEALSAAVVDRGSLVLVAPNGAIGMIFRWPPAASKAFKRSTPGRRAHWIGRHEKEMTLMKSTAETVALADLVNARLAAPSPLIGLSVAVVGCGAVGSRLVLDLIRCGAGLSDRPMLVIDPDTFEPPNLARHILPISALGEFKAQAMAEEARRLHPSVSVEPVVGSVFNLIDRLARYDVVIDATGANPVALRLNEEAVSRRNAGRGFPPVIHAAVHGNGLAVQTILVTDVRHACLKCLRPGHGLFKADPLRPGTPTTSRPAACGDGGHVPYAAAAPAMAAALAVQAALEWAGKAVDPGPRVRTRVLNVEFTSPAKDRNWPVEPACPACQRPTDEQ